MTKKLVDMKDVDWLKLYVTSEIDKFNKKFDIEFDQDEVEDICKIVSNLKLPEGLDSYVAMLLLLPSIYDEYVHLDLAKLKAQGLTLGLDMVTYMYSQFCITDGYDEQVAFIFKNCIQYCIPF